MEDIKQSLKKIVGSDYIATDKETLYAYSRDASPEPGIMGDIIIRPGSSKEISEILKIANETKTPVWPRGAATSLVFMGAPLKEGGIVLDLTRLNNIIEIDEDAMSVTAESGITWGKLEALLKKRNWFTGFIGPGPGYTSTIGGAVSVASVMYGSAKYGTACDILLGLEVVLPTGEIINTGSSAMKKSFKHTRYGIGPDSSGLFCGDNGIMGIKTKITFKLYPYPEYIRYIHYGYENFNQVINCLHEMASYRIASDLAVVDNKIGVSWGGSKRFPLHGLIKTYSEKMADAQVEFLEKINNKYGGEKGKEYFPKMVLEDKRYEMFPMSGRLGNFGASCNKIPIKRATEFHNMFLEFMEEYKREARKHHILWEFYAFISGNNIDILPTIMVPTDKKENYDFGRKLWKKLVQKEIKSGAIHYWLGKVIGDVVSDNYKREYFQFIRNIKQSIDPNNILNPTLLKL
ncbi:MAG: FAD-binding protein [Candidatus Lokiarchaeota archaeon]|nr:FAD-binding protein [Candidatus Lokiarchaeota archaeon]